MNEAEKQLRMIPDISLGPPYMHAIMHIHPHTYKNICICAYHIYMKQGKKLKRKNILAFLKVLICSLKYRHSFLCTGQATCLGLHRQPERFLSGLPALPSGWPFTLCSVTGRLRWNYPPEPLTCGSECLQSPLKRLRDWFQTQKEVTVEASQPLSWDSRVVVPAQPRGKTCQVSPGESPRRTSICEWPDNRQREILGKRSLTSEELHHTKIPALSTASQSQTHRAREAARKAYLE